MSVNKVILIGRAGKDPDVRTLDGGAKVASLSFATTDKAYTLQNGTQVPERTEWHNLIFWNKTAEIVEKAAHIYCICETMGGAKLLPESDIAIMHDFYKQHYSKRQIEKGDEVLE